MCRPDSRTASNRSSRALLSSRDAVLELRQTEEEDDSPAEEKPEDGSWTTPIPASSRVRASSSPTRTTL